MQKEAQKPQDAVLISTPLRKEPTEGLPKTKEELLQVIIGHKDMIVKLAGEYEQSCGIRIKDKLNIESLSFHGEVSVFWAEFSDQEKVTLEAAQKEANTAIEKAAQATGMGFYRANIEEIKFKIKGKDGKGVVVTAQDHILALLKMNHVSAEQFQTSVVEEVRTGLRHMSFDEDDFLRRLFELSIFMRLHPHDATLIKSEPAGAEGDPQQEPHPPPPLPPTRADTDETSSERPHPPPPPSPTSENEAKHLKKEAELQGTIDTLQQTVEDLDRKLTETGESLRISRELRSEQTDTISGLEKKVAELTKGPPAMVNQDYQDGSGI